MLHHTHDPVCPLCQDKLNKAHPYLKQWFNDHIKPEFPDAHVAWSYRNEQEQEQCFRDKATHCHYPDSPHNKQPAMALDLFEIDEDGLGKWSPGFFIKVQGYNQDNEIPLMWGGNFKSIGDRDHWQIKAKD